MNNAEKTQAQLIAEITELRKQITTLEITAAEREQLEADIQGAREYAGNIMETVCEPPWR